jgi:mannose-1-phosphate guanylyltransferase/phosphomannomutase
MKVVIMAGGEGMRLRPISANRPKPMVRLYDRPVLEHTLALLKQIGFDEACLTLRYLPQMITDYFGDGSQFGMKLHYKIEEQPLGTAGGVLNCKSFIGDDDTLVISGDCVCDFDLRKLIAFHRERNAEATLALYSHPNPLEYGLVVTDENGRVRHFLEKPAWDRVLTDQINTGIYILSPKTLDKIPQGEPYDFGKDLFPRLLKENAALYGVKMEGYWCDIGSTTAYRTCCIDLLDNEVFLRRLVPTGSGGLWSLTDIPENVTVTPPVYIGRDVTIEENAEIGPCAVIGSGASIRRGAVVRHSVVGHAVIGEGSRLEGAVVLDGAVIGRDAVLEDESVVGDGAAIGDRTRVAAKAKVWTGCDIPPDTTAEGELCRTENLRPLTFDKPGAVTDENGSVLTPHICLTLGEAAAKRGRVGVGWSGGDRARVFAEAFGCGVCAAGGELVRYDGSFLACAAYTAEAYRFDATVYIEEKGGVVTLNMFGPGGTVLTREEERRYEAAARGTQCRATGPYGTATTVTGSVETYIAAASKLASPWVCGERLPVAVTGGGAENRALKRALSLSGFEIGRKAPGIVTLEATEGGLWLTAEDEEGYRLSGERLAVILAHTALERGEKELYVPYEAPAVIEEMAEQYGAVVYRHGRDGIDAERGLISQKFLNDGIFAAVLLCGKLREGQTLSALRRAVPSVATVTRELPLESERGAVMKQLTNLCAAMTADMSSGLRIDTGRGTVLIAPVRARRALRIRSESFCEEIAAELCAEFEERVRQSDRPRQGAS